MQSFAGRPVQQQGEGLRQTRRQRRPGSVPGLLLCEKASASLEAYHQRVTRARTANAGLTDFDVLPGGGGRHEKGQHWAGVPIPASGKPDIFIGSTDIAT